MPLSSDASAYLRLCTKRRRLDPALLVAHRAFHASSLRNSDRDDKTVAIIGGGLGGLSTAHFLLRSLKPAAKSRTKILVIEKSARTGGWCRTERFTIDSQPVVFETGPRSIRPVGLPGWLTVKMAHDIGLGSRIVTVPKTAPSARKRYLLMPGSQSLEAAPNSVASMLHALATSSNFRSAMFGALTEPFRPRSPVHDLPEQADESVDSFFTRRFGKEMAETFASAIIHGIYSGDTRRLSVRAVFPVLWEAEMAKGSVSRWMWSRVRNRIDTSRPFEKRRALEKGLLKMIQDEVESTDDGKQLGTAMRKSSVWGLRGGLQTLVDELRANLESERVEVMPSTSVTSTTRMQDRWSLDLDNGQTVLADHIVAFSPSLLPSAHFTSPSIPGSTVAVVSLAFPKTTTRLVPPGFGYLIPRSVPASANPHQALGVIFDSDVMPGIDSSDELGLTKLSILFGGSYWLDDPSTPSSLSRSPGRLVEMALETLSLHFPGTDFPNPVKTVPNVHFDCIPQLPPGIGSDLSVLHRQMRRMNDDSSMPKISLVGGGPSGVGLNAVVQNAWEVGTSIGKSIEDGHRVLTGIERWDEE